MKKSLLLLLGCLVLTPVESMAQGQLEAYISFGLENNLVLKEKSIELEKSLLALKEAKSYFLPSLDFGANYTLASGGRTIDIPIGTLLNPVYATLNQLTGSNAFPQLENVSEQFLPDNFYDARFRASLPIYNKDLQYQKQIRADQIRISQYELEIYKSHLTQEIKIAYFTFLSAHTAVELIQSSKRLVLQNLKDNQSLLKNGKVLPAAVLRAESEVQNIEAMLIDAENKRKNSAQYFNFLLNRPLSEPIIAENQALDLDGITRILEETNLKLRPEILQIQTAESIQQTLLQSGRSFWVPKVNTFADLGSQAFDWKFDSRSRYLIWGLNLSVPIFQGGRNRTQIQRAQLGIQSIQNQMQLLDQKLHLELELGKNELQTQIASLKSAEKKLEAANAYFRLVDRGYREGVNSLIEFIDARNQFTQASLQQNIISYQVLKSLAQLERQLQTQTN
ncbi:outer membrane protein TolC [Algoriphagus aquaeductus]|uniref:Outer membrane protein TolC n=1 Tax=Algoriphagus aquaeductus TaxID=475299 RepID=A0A326RSQ8_9BACT|nr:TolC family protein [Algoriphagus aquaeductus]PZV83784.1 outer membrane protein TolC [Algoriphagus aquaeductus]